MTYNPKPAAVFQWATNPAAGDITAPLDALVSSGYLYNTKPAHDNFNWSFNLLGQWTQYLSTLDATVLPLAATFGDMWGDFVVNGFLPGTSATLTTPAFSGAAYAIGQRVSATNATVTVAASQDTYLDVDNTGALHLSGVANGGAAPAVYANSIRLAKIVSDATAITSVTDMRTLVPAAKAGQAMTNVSNTFTQPQTFQSSDEQILFGLDANGGSLTADANNSVLSWGVRYVPGSTWYAKDVTAAYFAAGSSGWSGAYDTGLTPGASYTPTVRWQITNLGKIIGAAPTTATASFNVPQGTSPTSPTSGDLWGNASADLFWQANGATWTFAWQNRAQTFSQLQTFGVGIAIGGGYWVDMGTSGTGTPTFTTRSPGTKFIYFDQVNATNVDYATGMDGSGRMWWSVASANAPLGWDWYAGQTKVVSFNYDGSATFLGTITTGAGNSTVGGIRFNGGDSQHNSIYLGGNDLGISVDSGKTLYISSAGGQGSSGLSLNTATGILRLWSGALALPASATASASLNLAPGVAPTTPSDGDVWVTSAGAYIQVAGITQQIGRITNVVTAGPASFTGTSNGAYQDVGASVTITTGANATVLVLWQVSAYLNGGNTSSIAISVDGTDHEVAESYSSANGDAPFGGHYLLTGVASGSHVIKIRYKNNVSGNSMDAYDAFITAMQFS